jgi:hypothetical protein
MCDSLETTEQKAEYIINLLKPCMKKSRNKEWSSERYNTEWGTKTIQGLRESIIRIIGANPEYLPKI